MKTRRFLLISFNKFKMDVAFTESRFPVGSSHKINLGFLINARAILTLCFCPPLKFETFRFSNPSNPTFLMMSLTLFSIFSVSLIISKLNAMFSLTVNSLIN